MAARILVIEDNPANLELMRYLLEAFGHSPMIAVDGESGLKAAQRERPDLILCDIQLPKMDGYEVARWIKNDPVLRTVPLMAVTAYAMVGDRDRMLAAGFDSYLSKPITPETFVKQVEAFLEEVHSRPIPPPPAESPSPQAVSPAGPSAFRATILAVDNSPVNLVLLCSTFEPLGYEVITAASPSEGRALARQRNPDMIMSDVHMPHEDGYEFLKSVQADPQLRSIPFILISSTVLRSDRESRTIPAGARAFILRPIETSVLVARVEACLAKKEESQG